MTRIFISYSRTDEYFARRLADSLEAMGADVWIDIEDIPVGQKWSTAIQEGLDSTDALVVVITPPAMDSTNVEDEWQYMLDIDRPVIPVLLEEAKVHFQLNRLQYVDFLNQDYAAALRELRRELQHRGIYLNEPPPKSTMPRTDPVPTSEVSTATSRKKKKRTSGDEPSRTPYMMAGLLLVLLLAGGLLYFLMVDGESQMPLTPVSTGDIMLTDTAIQRATFTARTDVAQSNLSTADAATETARADRMTEIALTEVPRRATMTMQAATDIAASRQETAQAATDAAEPNRPAIIGREDCITYGDASQFEIVEVNGSYILTHTRSRASVFDSESEARVALRIIQTYDLTQQCFVGRPDPPVTYWLADGTPPSGEIANEDCIRIDLDTVRIEETNRNYILRSGRSSNLISFGSNQDEAEKALSIIQHYRMEYTCYVGRPDPSFSYLRR